MITDGRPINVYARAWRAKYVTVTDICLMTTIKALMTVHDLETAYHLIRYSGCRGTTRYLIRWITNYAKTGYVHGARYSPGAVLATAWASATSLS